ncbi:MAG TPA: YHS domain-containing (seleno)protein [Gammaproteobacteria bacterium]|nr:YHS domain-containing (seleno)protein [Gammaproteobacteria bacterium]
MTAKTVLVAAAALLFSVPAIADKDPVFSTDAGAIRGFDPVAYFNEKRPVEGDSKISHRWNGAIWHFSSEENRAAFEATPEKYAPAYGGYCAYAVANGYTASTDPEAWSVVNGRLFLNYSLGVKKRWEKNTSGYIKSGDANWPGVLTE